MTSRMNIRARPASRATNINNCLKNGLLPVAVDAATLAELFEAASADEGLEVTVDLASQTLSLPSGSGVSFPIDDFSKQCLLEGGDQLSYIQQRMAAITAYESNSANALNTLA